MGNEKCPYCCEEIPAEAIKCKYCQSEILHSQRERIIARLSNLIAFPVVSQPPLSPCKANCYRLFGGSKNKARLNQCLSDCDAEEAVQLLAERLKKELIVDFMDIVWGGGDIDPVPLERSIRKRFAKGSALTKVP